MLSNILKNAVEASPDGESIAVSLSNSSPRAVRVRNSGEVPDSIRDRFFEKYVTSGKERGTGLGTYSAKLIAETQGGGIRLDSSEPGCTTIEIQLSAADSE
jgi:signal transduction histidine kinase